MKKQSKYPTEEFKREAVRLLENSDKTVPQLAKELGVSDKSLYRWRNQYGTSSKWGNMQKPPFCLTQPYWVVKPQPTSTVGTDKAVLLAKRNRLK